jgi:hypothetical protein
LPVVLYGCDYNVKNKEQGAEAYIWASEEASNRREGKWHKQEFCEPYSSLNIIGVIKQEE